MTSLVIAEHDNASIRPATFNTVTAAAQCGGDVHVLVVGQGAQAAAQAAAQIAGVAKVIHVDGEHFAHGLAENMAAQVIALASAAARRRSPGLGEPLDRLDRALERLRALHQPLKMYEADLEWRPGDESIDAEAVLAAAEFEARARRSSSSL